MLALKKFKVNVARKFLHVLLSNHLDLNATFIVISHGTHPIEK
jgi:hypothetical protein